MIAGRSASSGDRCIPSGTRTSTATSGVTLVGINASTTASFGERIVGVRYRSDFQDVLVVASHARMDGLASQGVLLSDEEWLESSPHRNTVTFCCICRTRSQRSHPIKKASGLFSAICETICLFFQIMFCEIYVELSNRRK